MIYLPKSFAEEMVAHARAEAPNECCGILAGAGGKILHLYRTTNSLKSPVRYNVEPKELLHIHQEIDNKGWELMGIYHSHTHTIAYPSATDIQLAFWTDAIYFIVSLMDFLLPTLRAFRIKDGQITEEEISYSA